MTYLKNIDPKTDPAVLSRRERKKLNQHYAIVQAALALFREKGYDDASISEIAEKADISYTTFFNYFPTKEDLLPAIEDMETKDLAEVAELRFADEPSATVTLKGVLEEWANDSIENQNASMRIQESVMQRHAEPFLGDIERLLADIVEQGVQRGEFRPDTDPALIATLLSGLRDAIMVNRRIDLLSDGVDAILSSIQN